jgi:hypothetical protein
MKKQQVANLHNALTSVKQFLDGLSSVEVIKFGVKTKFSYALNKNLALLELEIKLLQEAAKPNPEWSKYEEQRVQLVRKYGEKDANGILIQNVGGWTHIPDQVNYNKELLTLQAANKEVLKAKVEKDREVEKLLEEEVTIVLYKIPFDLFPSDGITPTQLEGVDPIIEKNDREVGMLSKPTPVKKEEKPGKGGYKGPS